ncbi:hypothetical protein ACHBTE_33285 [Streptomyces sp. M41]|uniref:hypothetical protein n=1 Tax=Streptomyces sp. M41 TaxID=3059412 RepID=UPI00374D471E
MRLTMVGLATGVIAPISVEALIAYIKGENYSFARALIVLGVISLAALVLLVIRSSSRNLRTSLDVSLFLAGLATFGVGTANVVDSAGDGSSALAKAWGVVFLGILVLTLAIYSHVVSRNGSALLLATRQSPAPKEVEQFNVDSVLTVHRFDDYQDADREVEEYCRQALDPQDLQFIGYYVDGRCRFHVDALEAATLNPYFRRSSRADRRLAYERSGRQLDWLIENLDVYMQHLSGGILIRVVFDVEQGALYYCNIDEGTYIMGVTMIQDEVLVADEKIRHLANELGHLPRAGAPPFVRFAK